jgi:hypothetical protein
LFFYFLPVAVVSPAAVGIQRAWAAYEDCSLVWIPTDADLPISVQDFETRQKTHLKDAVAHFSNDWVS